MYSDKTYTEARMVAERAHGHQTYDDIFPYVKHLDDVVAVLKRFGFSGKYIVGGYLHDTMEDGNLSYNDVKTYFGSEVAEMVYAVTDELGRNRRERKEKTLPKIAGKRDPTILKLADRIANLEHGGKIDMYRKEYPAFRDALWFEDAEIQPMWDRLNKILDRSSLLR